MISRGHREVFGYPYGFFLEMLEATVQEERSEMRRIAATLRVAVWGGKKELEELLR